VNSKLERANTNLQVVTMNPNEGPVFNKNINELATQLGKSMNKLALRKQQIIDTGTMRISGARGLGLLDEEAGGTEEVGYA
jgi:hypothetical protein